MIVVLSAGCLRVVPFGVSLGCQDLPCEVDREYSMTISVSFSVSLVSLDGWMGAVDGQCFYLSYSNKDVCVVWGGGSLLHVLLTHSIQFEAVWYIVRDR